MQHPKALVFIVISCAAVVLLGMFFIYQDLSTRETDSRENSPKVAWDDQSTARVFNDIKDITSFGPRALETEAHKRTSQLITDRLNAIDGMQVLTHETEALHDGITKNLRTIIGRFNPQNPQRIIIATHFDSIPKAYRDAHTPDAPMPGANNGASGVAIMLELAGLLSREDQKIKQGIDFIFFDGEEGIRSMGEGDPNWQALGSAAFVRDIKMFYPEKLPSSVVVIDMVCADLPLRRELRSWRESPQLTNVIWKIGRNENAEVFRDDRTTHQIGDDHTAFLDAKIPATLIIGFEGYKWYNTTEDTPDKCHNNTIQTVGKTLMRFIML